jgi:hypothetical protein
MGLVSGQRARAGSRQMPKGRRGFDLALDMALVGTHYKGVLMHIFRRLAHYGFFALWFNRTKDMTSPRVPDHPLPLLDGNQMISPRFRSKLQSIPDLDANARGTSGAI